MKFVDITEAVERMESLEKKIDLSFNGIMATASDEADNDGDYKTTIMGEAVSLNENGFEFNVEIQFIGYNSR